MEASSMKTTTNCSGCKMADKGLFTTDEVVHADKCLFRVRLNSDFSKRVAESVIADIRAGGPISEALKQCA